MTEEFQALEDEWAAIVARCDVARSEAFLAPDFVLLSHGGVAPEMPREAWLAALPAIETRSLDAVVLAAREHAGAAVVWARLDWDAETGGRDLSGEYAVTDVFVRGEGARWQPSWRSSVRLGDR